MREIRARVRGSELEPTSLQGDLAYEVAALVDNTNIDVPREITSHRPFIGPFYLKFRRWVYREIRMAMGPVIERQTDTNRRMARIILAQQQRIQQLEQDLQAMHAQQDSHSQR